MKKSICTTILCVFILTMGLWYNFPLIIRDHGVEAFDWWSNGIMIADMMYYETYEEEGIFLNMVRPSILYPEDYTEAYGIYEKMFDSYQVFELETYEQYTSNVVVQRYLYHLLLDILPISHNTLLMILEFINCLMAAVMITIILKWISGITNNITVVIIASTLVLFCPFFAMYGKNLYWCMWTIFLPMSAMICLLDSTGFSKLNNKKQIITLIVGSFCTCLVKQIFYFELVSTVMIAMSIPVFYYCINNSNKIKELVKKITALIIGAIASFGATMLIKYRMLCVQYGKLEAIDMISSNIISRTLGEGPGAVEVDLKLVLRMMFYKVYLSCKNLFVIDFKTTIFILGIVIIVCMFIVIIEKKKLDRSFVALLVCCCISIAAPVSWFVLAAPHSYIHNVHVSIAWFCPYGILFLALIAKIILLLIKGTNIRNG